MSKKAKNTPIIKAPYGTKTESYKRPDHPDFMTSEELKKIEFTGIRNNTIGLQWEFWILGNMERAVSFQAVAKDKFALTKAHVEVFAMTPDPDLFKR